MIVHLHEPYYHYLMPAALRDVPNKVVVATVQSNMPINKKVYRPKVERLFQFFGTTVDPKGSCQCCEFRPGASLWRPLGDDLAPHCRGAIHAGDRFALRVLQESLTYLASTITAVHAAIGIRRYILIGGFARAVGDLYIESLLASCGASGVSVWRRTVSPEWCGWGHLTTIVGWSAQVSS